MKDRKSGFDPLLIGLAVVATLVGMFMIWDASYVKASRLGQVIPAEFLSQLKWAFVAGLVFWGASRLRREHVRMVAAPAAVLAVVASILVLVPGIGAEKNGAMRWLVFGPIQIQPSEFLKLCLILAFAAFFASPPAKPSPRLHWSQKLDYYLPHSWPYALAVIAFAACFKQKDLDTAALLVMILIGMMAAGGVSWRAVGSLAACLVVAGGVLAFADSYRGNRVAQHLHRWEAQNRFDSGFQSRLAETAAAQGGLAGRGIGKGEVKKVIPEESNDFIMATVAEEFGLLGSWAVIGLLAAIAWRLLHLARSAEAFPRLVLVGVACWISVQAAANIMSANATLPVMGINLPFISSGGSSLISLWLALGISVCVLTERAPARAKEVAPHADRRHRRRDGRTRLSRA